MDEMYNNNIYLKKKVYIIVHFDGHSFEMSVNINFILILLGRR